MLPFQFPPEPDNPTIYFDLIHIGLNSSVFKVIAYDLDFIRRIFGLETLDHDHIFYSDGIDSALGIEMVLALIDKNKIS